MKNRKETFKRVHPSYVHNVHSYHFCFLRPVHTMDASNKNQNENFIHPYQYGMKTIEMVKYRRVKMSNGRDELVKCLPSSGRENCAHSLGSFLSCEPYKQQDATRMCYIIVYTYQWCTVEPLFEKHQLFNECYCY